MSDALFLDTSSMNALYKVNGMFNLGVNYMDTPAQLLIDANALGSAYDVYITVWPRMVGEGDIIVPSLNMGSVPFCVLKEEAEAIIKFAKGFYNANDVFICNGLANYTVHTRLNKFQSVFMIANRCLLITVSDGLLEGIEVFNSQKEFYEEKGESFSCYGDVDIISVESIRSQYPEFQNIQKNDMVPLVPLIASYKSPYKISLAEFESAIFGGESISEQEAVEEPKEPEVVEETKQEEPEPEIDEPIKEDEPAPKTKAKKVRNKPKKQFGVSSVVYIVLCCILSIVLGVGYRMSDLTSEIGTYRNNGSAFVRETTILKDVTHAYSTERNIVDDVDKIMKYATMNTVGVQPISVVGNNDGYAVSVVAASVGAKDSFVSYMERSYLVLDTVELGMSEVDSISGFVYEIHISTT